ncbi:maleylpyruvate isomerase N-terminal domain-containing protein [Hymenobacter sp. BT186]|uniref:Maleylpyruvate isomerase N-terminal domain-containing protein n=1 Tax=Hymenobacter telluris TaxID=2816474 RepID=A0A939EWU9_9BACT|nr:maleylpyruvate isomerase N-terminal domain-containing protein [Hymenobacter telluris]MBO0358506.1 maleylpyruvate isomerase N-terminal domain-containing protein [Hymenobacter telluris]MBW3374532.1 maleylpyruvate isomerase N-terminal domain-containing protein [Hymenobacter norwichensis]
MQPLPILSTAHLFPVLDQHLLTLLRALEPADWLKPTVAPKWCVHDVALHLLDGSLRTLSMLRDGHFGSSGPASPAPDDVVLYLNQLNADWVRAGQRLSPQLVAWLLEAIGPAYNSYMASLPLLEPAVFSVGWAGEEQSLNWFHVARDYTEKWHHQQQIRQAVGQEQPLLTPELYSPFLATCIRALPHHYRNVAAAPGTTLQFTVTGAGGGTWFLQRQATTWHLGTDYRGPVAATITLDGAVAWRLFTKSLPRTEAQRHITTTGKPQLTEPIFSLVTVMA